VYFVNFRAIFKKKSEIRLELVQDSLTESKMSLFLPPAENPEQALKIPISDFFSIAIMKP